MPRKKKPNGDELINVEHEEEIEQAEAERVERKNARDEAQPSKKYEFAIDQPATLLPLIADVWNESKGTGDASFNDCAPAFKEILLHHALDVLKSRKVMQVDGPLAQFEQKIADITA